MPPRLQQILKRELNRDLNVVEESLRRKAVDYVRGLLVEAFREFRQMQPPTRMATNTLLPREAEASRSQAGSRQTLEPHLGTADSYLVEEMFGGFDFDYDFSGTSFLGDIGLDGGDMIESLIPLLIDDGGKKQSDSGYGSNSPELGRRDLSSSLENDDRDRRAHSPESGSSERGVDLL